MHKKLYTLIVTLTSITTVIAALVFTFTGFFLYDQFENKYLVSGGNGYLEGIIGLSGKDNSQWKLENRNDEEVKAEKWNILVENNEEANNSINIKNGYVHWDDSLTSSI